MLASEHSQLRLADHTHTTLSIDENQYLEGPPRASYAHAQRLRMLLINVWILAWGNQSLILEESPEMFKCVVWLYMCPYCPP